MYAIVELGGRQWKVEPGSRVDINQIAAVVGGQHQVDRVLLACNGQALQVGRPYVEGVSVVCEVMAHFKGPKTIAYHYRRRENWRKTVGHRQPLTRLLVKDILFGSTSASVAQPVAKAATVRVSPSRPTIVKRTPKSLAAPAPKPSKQADSKASS